MDSDLVYNYPILGHSWGFETDSIKFWEQLGNTYEVFKQKYPNDLFAIFMFGTRRMAVPMSKLSSADLAGIFQLFDALIIRVNIFLHYENFIQIIFNNKKLHYFTIIFLTMKFEKIFTTNFFSNVFFRLFFHQKRGLG